MNWETLEERCEFEDIMDEEGLIHGTQSIMVHFDDGEPTGVTVTLKGGLLLRFHSSSIDERVNNGTRETLFVSIENPYKNEGEVK